MAQDALFYHDGEIKEGIALDLTESTAKHVVQVLRMNIGDTLQLTNGNGVQAFTEIIEVKKKACRVNVNKIVMHEAHKQKCILCVAFTKNTSRNEWILEKATELGITDIVPLHTKRSERTRIREDRWESIIVSALIQSQQFHKPILHELTTPQELMEQFADCPQKMVAHCIDEDTKNGIATVYQPDMDTMILIGPEGDFTEEEIELCIGKGCKPVSLGNTRLRTETAAIAACSYIKLANND